MESIDIREHFSKSENLAEISILPRRLIDGTRSPWFSLVMKTPAGFRLPTDEEQADYNFRDAW